MFGLYKKSYVNRDNLYIIFFGKRLKAVRSHDFVKANEGRSYNKPTKRLSQLRAWEEWPHPRESIIEMMDTIYYSGTVGKFFESSG